MRLLSGLLTGAEVGALAHLRGFAFRLANRGLNGLACGVGDLALIATVVLRHTLSPPFDVTNKRHHKSPHKRIYRVGFALLLFPGHGARLSRSAKIGVLASQYRHIDDPERAVGVQNGLQTTGKNVKGVAANGADGVDNWLTHFFFAARFFAVLA